jgi:hypothetical protein
VESTTKKSSKSGVESGDDPLSQSLPSWGIDKLKKEAKCVYDSRIFNKKEDDSNYLKVWFIRYFHQSRIPNLRIFLQIFIMIFFSTGKLRKNTCFEPIRILFSFSTAQTEKNSWKKIVKQIGEII